MHDEAVTRSVLIVDDHEPFRRVVRELLQDSGHRVVGEAATGRQALAMVAALRPEAVLLDVGLPDMSGFAVAEQLTGGGHGPAIVLTSADPEADYEALAAGAGARRFVAKSELAGAVLAQLWC